MPAVAPVDENKLCSDNAVGLVNGVSHKSLITNQFKLNEELVGKVKLPEFVTLDERLLCDVEMLLMGAFQPLQGFLNLSDYIGCCKDMRLTNGKLWAMPIVLPVKFSDVALPEVSNASGLSTVLRLKDITGKTVAEVEVESVFLPDLKYEQEQIFLTASENHPHVKFMNQNYSDVFYVGGKVRPLNGGIVRFDYPQYRQPADKVKEYIKQKGYKKVVGFQTRNPMHRAHMELTVEALRDAMNEDDTKEQPHLMITPAVGPTQPGDVPMSVRVKCYKEILPHYPRLYREEFPNISEPDLVLLPLAMRMGGPREAVWHAMIRANYGCTHFVVGRDHAGPSSKNDNGEPFYGAYQAHELLQSVSDDIGVKVCYAKMFAWCGEGNGFLPFGKIPEGVTPINVSGTEQREILARGENLPSFFSFPEVSAELRKFYKPEHQKGLVLYLMGLPCSGKSTIAEALQAKLEIEDSRSVTILDGDIVRTHLSKGLGFSKEDRSLNVTRIGFVASLISKSGGIAIAANIAPFAEDRKTNREAVDKIGANYVEIFVDTDLNICEERDVKGLYKKAREGIIPNFTGISDPFERPENPEITLKNVDSVETAVNKIYDYILSKKYVLSG